MPRGFIPLDLRNIKDIASLRAQLRRINDYLIDLSQDNAGGPGAAPQPGNTSLVSNPPISFDSVDPERVGPRPKPGTRLIAAHRDHVHDHRIETIDDFTRQMTGTQNWSVRSFEGLQWFTPQVNGTSTIKDVRTAADTTYPDTGIWLISLDAAGDPVDVRNADISADALQFYSKVRHGTKYHFGVAISGSHFMAHWGWVYEAGGNSYQPFNCARIIAYKGAKDYDDSGVFGPGIFTFHGFGSKQDFIALQITTSNDGKSDLYYIGAASALIGATSITDSFLLFERDGSGNYNITAAVDGIGSVTVNATDAFGYMAFGARYSVASDTGTSGGKLWMDYVAIEHPIPWTQP